MCITQLFVQAHIKKTLSSRHWPLWGESTGDRWIPLTKGQERGNCFLSWRHHDCHSHWASAVATYRFPLVCKQIDPVYCSQTSRFWPCFRALEYTVEGQVVIGTPRMSLNLSRKHRWFWRTATVNLTEVYCKPHHRIRMLEGRIVRSRKVSNTRD